MALCHEPPADVGDRLCFRDRHGLHGARGALGGELPKRFAIVHERISFRCDRVYKTTMRKKEMTMLRGKMKEEERMMLNGWMMEASRSDS